MFSSWRSNLPGDCEFETSKSPELSRASARSFLWACGDLWSCSFIRDFLFEVRIVLLYLLVPITSLRMESSSISRASWAIDGFGSAVWSLVFNDCIPIIVAADSA